MIANRNAGDATGLDKLTGNVTVGGGGRRVTARVVVDENDRRRAFMDGEPEHFTRVNNGYVENPSRNLLHPPNPVLRVEHQNVEPIRGLTVPNQDAPPPDVANDHGPGVILLERQILSDTVDLDSPDSL